METRKHVHKEDFALAPEALFSLLLTPSQIRKWWGADRAIVIPLPGGTWVAAWGEEEDKPDYIMKATISVLEEPHRLVLEDFQYNADAEPLPFEADFTTEFIVAASPAGASLQVIQDGFPSGSIADDFYVACETGWKDTFVGIRKLVESQRQGSD